MPESMDFKDLDSTIILTPDECWEAYHHHRYTNPWFNLTEVNINRPTSHSYISKGQHDETGTCVGETFVRQGDLHTSVYERTEVRLLVQEHLLHTLPGVLSMSGMDVNLPFNVRVPAERQNLTDERFGVMVWRHDEPKCAKEVQYTSVYYNLFTGSVDVHFRWISHNSAAFFYDFAVHRPDVRICSATRGTANAYPSCKVIGNPGLTRLWRTNSTGPWSLTTKKPILMDRLLGARLRSPFLTYSS